MRVAYKRRETLSNIIKDVLGMEEEPIKSDPGAFGDLAGLSNEFKACYVLIDHRRPFLPFSIMQAPITPSHIRPGIASGDLYLFEENLVIDVMRGHFLGGEQKIPSAGNLREEVEKIIEGSRWLFGIRKGIGVVLEEEDYIHLAVYVPWRDLSSPLVHLKSLKLPFLIYMNNVKEEGVEPHEARVEGDAVQLTIKAFMLADRVGVDKLRGRLKLDGMMGTPSLRALDREGSLEIMVKVEADKILLCDKEVRPAYPTALSCEGFVLTKLYYDKGDDECIVYPVVAILKE